MQEGRNQKMPIFCVKSAIFWYFKRQKETGGGLVVLFTLHNHRPLAAPSFEYDR
jgi:hypothetical protein